MPKKNTALTIEERLQQALVPAEEQPYEVPENWVWVRLTNIISLSTGKKDANYGSDKGVYPFFTCASEPIACNDYSFDGESILVPGNGANVGLVIYYNGKFEAYQRTYVIQKSKFNIKFIYYNMLAFWDEHNRNKQYGSATNYIKLGNFESYNIALPPLSEQQRIVERIEELFAKLDEAKERLQEVADSFAVRKAAILHKAFTGELTQQWRRENGVSDESWEEKKLGEVGVLERGRSKHRPRNDERLFGGIYPFIQTGDVANADMFIEKHSQTLSDFGMQQSKLFAKNTICITIAANIGKVAILSYDSCFPDSVVGLTTDEKNSYKYVYYYLSTQQKELESKAPATAQKNINLKVLNDLDIPLPSLPEQHEIVRLIDDLLARERSAQQAAEQALVSIELMKKSILARAFRGELSTNKASEASALELLKQVLAEN